jgi:L-2-hydroxyglutarate oxidase LhgO
VHRLVPDIRADDLVPSKKVGIRPQLINLRTQKLEKDFVIETTPTSVHVLNAISPAFTSAFAFAELLVERRQASCC